MADKKLQKIEKKISKPDHPMHEFFLNMRAKGVLYFGLKNLLYGHRNDHQVDPD